jgi:hypothetical protein
MRGTNANIQKGFDFSPPQQQTKKKLATCIKLY